MTSIHYANNQGQVTDSIDIDVDLSNYDEIGLGLRLATMKGHLEESIHQGEKASRKSMSQYIDFDSRTQYARIAALAGIQINAVKHHIDKIEAML